MVAPLRLSRSPNAYPAAGAATAACTSGAAPAPVSVLCGLPCQVAAGRYASTMAGLRAFAAPAMERRGKGKGTFPSCALSYMFCCAVCQDARELKFRRNQAAQFATQAPAYAAPEQVGGARRAVQRCAAWPRCALGLPPGSAPPERSAPSEAACTPSSLPAGAAHAGVVWFPPIVPTGAPGDGRVA